MDSVGLPVSLADFGPAALAAVAVDHGQADPVADVVDVEHVCPFEQLIFRSTLVPDTTQSAQRNPHPG